MLTSDRLPRDMAALEDRLRERFEAGLVCDVRPPDFDTRLTILRKRVQQDGVRAVDAGALELIAERVDSNIRALEGALIRIVAFGSLTGRPVTAELAEEVLGGLYPDLRPRARSVEEIQRRICQDFEITLDELLSHSRAAGLELAAPARHVPHARAHRRDAARDRARVRRPQPHDRPARLQAHRRAHRRGPRGVRHGAQAAPASCAAVPTGMLDRLVHPSAPHPARNSRRLCTPSTTLMTVTPDLITST